MPKGKFKSQRQRRYMWARAPKAAHKWAHNRRTTRKDWAGKGKTKRPRTRAR